jgi:hypothetical protein
MNYALRSRSYSKRHQLFPSTLLIKNPHQLFPSTILLDASHQPLLPSTIFAERKAVADHEAFRTFDKAPVAQAPLAQAAAAHHKNIGLLLADLWVHEL